MRIRVRNGKRSENWVLASGKWEDSNAGEEYLPQTQTGVYLFSVRRLRGPFILPEPCSLQTLRQRTFLMEETNQ